MPDKQAAELLERFRAKLPSETTLGIYAFQKAHRSRAAEKFKGYVKDFEDCFEVQNTFIRSLNFVSKTKWPNERGVQFLLYPECLKTLHRAFEDTLDGYYDEAEMLHRNVYETLLRIIFVSCFPTDWEAILYDRKGRRAFNSTNFCQDDLKVDWKFIYHLMCKISHSKIHRHLPVINSIARGEKHGEITLSYMFDPKFIWLPINTSVFLLFALISISTELFLADLEGAGAKPKDIDRLKDARLVLRHHISENPGEKFRQLANDVEKIQRIIAACKSGQDWRSFA